MDCGLLKDRGVPMDWMNRWRRFRVEHPDRPLVECIGVDRPDTMTLLELACADLMHRQRDGRDATVEDYLVQFSRLQLDDHRLDLIDAEICIRQELGRPNAPEDWFARFPKDRAAIMALLQLDEIADVSVGSSSVFESAESSTSADAPGGAASRRHDDEISLASPDWFVGHRVVATSPGSWLIRGRHRDDNRSMAMKLLALPPGVTPIESKSLLELVEAAGEIDHPLWVAPESSTIQNRHLGVLRPWVDGVAWSQSSPSVEDHLRRIAMLCGTVQFAFSRGVQHGGINENNLIIGHDGKIHLLDAVCNRGMIGAVIHGRDKAGGRASRVQRDVASLLSLLAIPLASSDHPDAARLLDACGTAARQTPDDAPAFISDQIHRLIDQRPIQMPRTDGPMPRTAGKRRGTAGFPGRPRFLTFWRRR